MAAQKRQLEGRRKSARAESARGKKCDDRINQSPGIDWLSAPEQVTFGLLITREEFAEQRAYFTETVTATICDIEVTGGQLVILRTHVKVPAS